ncbi:c-type cytochrome [Massilia phyllosphaerae]|uniref:c-type cytochrome n=1 Tax=Massilia phyllosphaerae TaxID=3106034 RepID=UPI002B1CB3F9|nr:c-type cytochrome [Massilia sp. SGZ-792]
MDPAPRPRTPKRRTRLIVLAVLVLLAVAAFAIMWRPAIEAQTAAPVFDAATIERGQRLAMVGTCAACHTIDPSRPYAGGFALATPFGTVHSTNITPDARTGIGQWSEAAFTRALREGVSRDGHLLYPAFPYDHYTKLAQDDIRAMYAYFMTRPALEAPAHQNAMTFPFGFRPLVAFWNILYLKREPWQPVAGQSAEWNRGAYLSVALAHCTACHTPRTKLGGTDFSRHLDGGEAEGWYVPALNEHNPSPIPWTRDHLAEYLRTGIAPDHAVAGGPMQASVENLRLADPKDIDAIATYIHSYLAKAPPRRTRAAMPGSLPAPTANDPDLQRMQLGYSVYANSCARCHDVGRDATSGAALQLQKAVALYDPDPRSLIHIVVEGIAPPDGEPARWMPGFATILTDEQTGALAAYLRRYGAGQPQWEHIEDQVKKAKQP